MGRAGLLTPNWVSFDYGSGVVIGDRGEILTTFHVVKGAARLVVRAAGARASRPRSSPLTPGATWP